MQPVASAEPVPVAAPTVAAPTVQPVSPAAAASRPVGPLVIRVGLASDLRSFRLPCCDPRLVLHAGGEALPLTQAFEVEAVATLQRAVYRLQVAALKDERQARGLAERLAETTGQPADEVFDAGTDLYRVRVGRYADRAQAEQARRHLEGLGLRDLWIASEGRAPDNPAFEITGGGSQRAVSGRWLEITAPPNVGVPYQGVRYRGRLLVFLNDRGSLNIVNELPLEDYLRGVVPKEMGPELYNQLEALKAQAVAARTYVVRNLEEFAGEGFDICSTPRCQVYGGMKVEHRVSDRAINETAGQVVLFDGQPAETFYGATCGGHTENVEVVFPLKTGAYLRGVPCLESGVSHLTGAPAGGELVPDLMRRLLPPGSGKPNRVLAARMEYLATLAELSVPRDGLRSLRREEVMRFVASVFDLALDPRLRGSHQELVQLLTEAPANLQPRARELASYLVSSRLLALPGRVEMSPAEIEGLLFHLAEYLGVVQVQDSRFLALDQGRLAVKTGRFLRTHALSDGFSTYRLQERALRAASLELMAGDRLQLYWSSGQLAAVAQPFIGRSVDFGGRVTKQSWSRFVPAAKLRSAVQSRYPGFPFEDFEVLSRGVSGRVGKLRLLGTGGRSLEIEGLAVRWTLDVWDTLFWAEPHRAGDRGPGWTFRGKGWGHGVGLCQAGAFGMAMRGSSYRDILGHYYTGIQLGRLKPAPARPRFAATEG
ncbi:MAG: SpoIID/LytB domain-containing protein [Acidobacteriota bacterium]